MATKAEIIGVGPLWQGTPHPSGRAEYPDPYSEGTPIGQHLRVERLLRVADSRHYYLVNNLGPKWNRRKCWACGNKYSPNRAQSCDYCLTPLRDLSFVMTARWKPDEFVGVEHLVRARLKFLGHVTPVALIYRGSFQLAVYHYHDEGLLLDKAAPLEPHVLLSLAQQLGQALHKLHDHGVVLRRLTAQNVLVMPDTSVRLFDLDPHAVLGDRRALASHRRNPIQADTRQLGKLLLGFCGPEFTQLRQFFARARDGVYENPGAFARDVERLLFAGAARAVQTFASGYTDLGLKRRHNEDRWDWLMLTEDATTYVLADGMGGHEAGDVAASLAVQTVLDSLGASLPKKLDVKSIVEALEKSMVAANTAVVAQGHKKKKKMGTTLVVLVVLRDEAVVVGNVGDSRCYLLRGGVIEQLSRDHSIVQELVEAGRIDKESARTHKNAHILTSTIGAASEPEVDIHSRKCLPGDRLLLCSDGLWGEVTDERIAHLLASQPDRRACAQSLVRAAYEAGGSDNIAVQVVDIP